MPSTSGNQDRPADPIYVSRAEAELALDQFPSENPFAHLDQFPLQNPFAQLVKPKETLEPLAHLTVEAVAQPEIDTTRVDTARRPRSARAWLVAAVIVLGATFGASLQPLMRSETAEPASNIKPEPTPATATEPTPPVVTPPVVTPPVVTPMTTPPIATPSRTVPSTTQPLRAEAAPSSTRTRAEAPAVRSRDPIPARGPTPPPPPSPALAIAPDARLSAAKGIALGELASPPKPSPGTRTTNTTPPPSARGTTSASPPPPVAPAPASPRDGTADASAVQAVVDSYARAFSKLDVDAAGAIWPLVDVKALTRSFERLDSQSIEFSGCQIKVTDALADASCAGQTRYVPKIGRKSERVESHEWTFALRKVNGRWLIMSVRSK